MSRNTIFALATILLTSALLGSSMLTRGHTWGDDWAAYTMQAKSILSADLPGFIEHNTLTIKGSSSQLGPIAYPWGYPLLLAPVYWILRLSPLGLKLPGLIFYLAFLGVFYALMHRRISQTESLLAVSLFAFNPTLLLFLDNILSDIPFLFVSTLAVLLIDKYAATPKRGLAYPLAIGATIFAAFFLRTPGIILLGIFLAYQAWRIFLERDLFKGIAIDSLQSVTVFGLFWLASSSIFPNGQDSYFSHFEEYGFGLESVAKNAEGYFQVIGQFFSELPTFEFIFWIFVGFFIFGMVTRLKADMLFILALLPVYLANVIWPEWQGVRFMFPVLPFFIYFAILGMKYVAQIMGDEKTIFVCTTIVLIAILFLGSSSLHAFDNLKNGREINGPFDPYSVQLYDFIKAETPLESVIVFFKPRALRLMTDRDSISVTQCDQLTRGDYIALSKKVEDNLQIPPEEIESCGLPLERVYQNRRFVVYQVMK